MPNAPYLLLKFLLQWKAYYNQETIMIPFSRTSPLEQYYKILDKLGKGGMGTTHAAEDVNTGKKVALKVISLQNQTDAKSLELLEREVTVLKKLNHPNIPKYIDYFQLEDDNKLYLVEELVAGKNLNQQVEEGLRLTEKEVKDIAFQVLSILDYLHNFDARIIHRDIKPIQTNTIMLKRFLVPRNDNLGI